MNIEAAFYQFLNNNSAVTDFFNDIEPHKRTKPLPMLTYRFISYPGIYEVGLKFPRVQFDIWGNTYSEIKQGRVLMLDELHDWRGNMNGVSVKNIVLMSEQEDHEEELDIWRQIMDFKIIFLK